VLRYGETKPWTHLPLLGLDTSSRAILAKLPVFSFTHTQREPERGERVVGPNERLNENHRARNGLKGCWEGRAKLAGSCGSNKRERGEVAIRFAKGET
jgi:hypothetical protein